MAMFSNLLENEKAIPIDLGIKWDAGAPQPRLLQSEYKTFLACFLDQPNQPLDGTRISFFDPASPEPDSVGIIEWHRCFETMLGWPNEEALSGHRLWAKGLKELRHYSSAEVQNSSWIAEIEHGNRVHPSHKPAIYASLKHYILLFHDSTFECLARG